MNITDYVHGRCTVERVTIKTSLKVNGRGGGGRGKEEKRACRTPTDSASHRSQKNKQEL